MNKLNGIIDNGTFLKDKLYLIEKPTNNFGFFYQDGIVYFGKRNENGEKGDFIDTAFLDMNINVHIESITENASFETGYYDIISFKGDLDSNYFDVFYKICCIYSNDFKQLSFSDFFLALVNIFNKDGDQSYKNLAGLMGELYLIKNFYEHEDIDISLNWHKTGTTSKFDFSFKESNLEVKTTTSFEHRFKIKHNQLFNNQNNFVAVVSLIETGEGESVESIFDYFFKTEPFSSNVKFQIALNNELFKITDMKDRKKGFVINDINFYSINDMETIQEIPSCIKNIEYDYDFTNIIKTDVENII